MVESGQLVLVRQDTNQTAKLGADMIHLPLPHPSIEKKKFSR